MTALFKGKDRARLSDEELYEYAEQTQTDAVADAAAIAFYGVGGGGAPHIYEQHPQYAIEPCRGGPARSITQNLVESIEELPDYRDEARLVVRTVTFGPWRYVTPEEVDAATDRDTRCAFIPRKALIEQLTSEFAPDE
ncbi:hypothetical protein [Mycobacteroides abscessus]|uniref:hypothetical protein n=1 Tax=Mycobacteroides abscessus TaxID=36809 RepID=UPI0009A8EC71|nr:hypothetical protein [Mycobacteroides abscessus]SLH39065.1 Uncharacterised protein [Mycobacteroides abscessus subsp. massiliense]